VCVTRKQQNQASYKIHLLNTIFRKCYKYIAFNDYTQRFHRGRSSRFWRRRGWPCRWWQNSRCWCRCSNIVTMQYTTS